jgi:hypothetical protein
MDGKPLSKDLWGLKNPQRVRINAEVSTHRCLFCRHTHVRSRKIQGTDSTPTSGQYHLITNPYSIYHSSACADKYFLAQSATASNAGID